MEKTTSCSVGGSGCVGVEGIAVKWEEGLVIYSYNIVGQLTNKCRTVNPCSVEKGSVLELYGSCP